MNRDFGASRSSDEYADATRSGSFASVLAEVVERPDKRDSVEHLGKHHLLGLVLGELSHVMWQERDLITQLVFRLEVQQFILSQERTRWIELATEDVNDALADVRRQEVFRTELLQDLSPLLGTPPDVSLRDLIASLDTPWDGIFTEHHAAFLELTAEAEMISRANSELLHRGLGDIGDLLNAFGHRAEDAYVSRARKSGPLSHEPSGSVLVDKDA